jgi:pimeloyl-ACP methyl ester carboxylesterase
MKNVKTKNWRKRALFVLLIVFGFYVGISIIAFAVNTVLSQGELDGIQPYGELVDVDGRKMHVYSMGHGENTIVLLPGLGVALPSADFGPLMRKLSETYVVVTVEYFGMGFSDLIDTPRTNQNYISEVRAALDQAGFEPPYILMPHSASGVYSEYYAAIYPGEVSAIIMMDTTSTAFVSEETQSDLFFSLSKLSQAIGNARILSRIIPDTKLIENGYTENEIEHYRLFSFHAVNNTMINQAKKLMDNIAEVKELPFPETVPVLKLIAQETVDEMAKQNKDDGMVYQNDHLNRLGSQMSYEVLDAAHLLYQTHITEIVMLTNVFLVQNIK